MGWDEPKDREIPREVESRAFINVSYVCGRVGYIERLSFFSNKLSVLNPSKLFLMNPRMFLRRTNSIIRAI
jgi:hypothetical protein